MRTLFIFLAFNATHIRRYPLLRIDAAAVVAREPQVKVVVTTTGSLWLVNQSEEKVTVHAGELFGFNVGSYAEIPSGVGVWLKSCHSKMLYIYYIDIYCIDCIKGKPNTKPCLYIYRSMLLYYVYHNFCQAPSFQETLRPPRTSSLGSSTRIVPW